MPREAELLRENEALRARVLVLEARLSALEESSGRSSPTGQSASMPPPAPRTPPLTPPPPSQPSPSQPSLSPPPLPRRGPIGAGGAWSTEQFIGRRIVPFVGSIAVLGAIAFLVHYAYDIGLIGRIAPMGRFAIGVVLGILLLGAGEWVRRRGAPGAATGLDAAGIGSVMVTVALGVFSLRVFGPATGAAIAAAAGVLGAAWSVRSGSVAVGVVALIGFLGLPPAVGLPAEQPRLAGLLLALALATGLGMHAIGGARFAAVRYFALAATVLLGAVVLGATASPLEAFGFAILWWGIVVGESTFAALRGASARGNVAMVALASSALVLVEVGAWTTAAGVLSAVELLPASAGALLLALAALLRGFSLDDGEAVDSSGGARVDPSVHSSVHPSRDPSAALDRSARAIGEACAMLSRASLAFGVALAVGGLAFLVGDSAKGIVVVAAAVVCSVLVGRGAPGRGTRVFALVAVLLSWIGAITATVVALGAPSVPAFASIPMPAGAPGGAAVAVDLFWRDGLGGLILCALALFGMLARTGGRIVGIGAVPAALLAWCAAVALFVPSPEACVAIVLPAFVVGWWRRAPLVPVVVGLLLVAIAALVWTAGLVGPMLDGPLNSPMRSALMLPPCAVVAMLVAAHPALGFARRAAMLVAVCAVGAACAAVGLAFGAHTGHRGIEAVLGASTVLALAGVVAVLVGRWRRSEPVVDGGMIMSAVSVAVGALLGLAWLFETRPSGEVGAASVLGMIAATALAAVVAIHAGRRMGGPFAGRAVVVGFACAAAAGPLGALLAGVVAGRPISPVVAVGGLAAVGVAELLLGFRHRIAPLRWAGLWAFFLLVARLFLVDLADAPVLVRIGLLFVSGMVLVGAGIVYARSALPSQPSRRTDGGGSPDPRTRAPDAAEHDAADPDAAEHDSAASHPEAPHPDRRNAE